MSRTRRVTLNEEMTDKAVDNWYDYWLNSEGQQNNIDEGWLTFTKEMLSKHNAKFISKGKQIVDSDGRIGKYKERTLKFQTEEDRTLFILRWM